MNIFILTYPLVRDAIRSRFIITLIIQAKYSISCFVVAPCAYLLHVLSKQDLYYFIKATYTTNTHSDTHVYIHTYIYTHTYTHTHTKRMFKNQEWKKSHKGKLYQSKK